MCHVLEGSLWAAERKRKPEWTLHLQFVFCQVSRGLEQEASCSYFPALFLPTVLRTLGLATSPTLALLWTRQALWPCICRLFCLECSLHRHRHDILLFEDNPSLVEPSVSLFLLLTRGKDWHPSGSCMYPRLAFSLLMVIVCLSIFTRMLAPLRAASVPVSFLFLQWLAFIRCKIILR